MSRINSVSCIYCTNSKQFKNMPASKKFSKNYSVSFKGGIDDIDFENLYHRDHNTIENAISNGNLRKIGAGQENEIFSNSKIPYVIKKSISSTPATIRRMQENLQREKNLVEKCGKFLNETNTSIAEMKGSFIDSNGHLTAIYPKGEGRHYTNADLNDMEKLRALASASADLRRAGIRYPDDHKKNSMYTENED